MKQKLNNTSADDCNVLATLSKPPSNTFKNKKEFAVFKNGTVFNFNPFTLSYIKRQATENHVVITSDSGPSL